MVKYCAGATARIMSPLWRGHIIFFGKKGEKTLVKYFAYWIVCFEPSNLPSCSREFDN